MWVAVTAGRQPGLRLEVISLLPSIYQWECCSKQARSYPVPGYRVICCVFLSQIKRSMPYGATLHSCTSQKHKQQRALRVMLASSNQMDCFTWRCRLAQVRSGIRIHTVWHHPDSLPGTASMRAPTCWQTQVFRSWSAVNTGKDPVPIGCTISRGLQFDSWVFNA